MRLVLSLFLPRWSIDLSRRRAPRENGAAILLVRPDHGREVVARACEAARRAGVAPGMTIAHARALLPRIPVRVEPHDPARDLRVLRRLAERMIEVVPLVALDPPAGLLMDASGCERMYGGVDPILRRVFGFVRSLGLTARLAAAPTVGAAWGLARFGSSAITRVGADELESALPPLPVEALRLDEDVAERLREVGVERIAHLLDLPREGLASRYGDGLLPRLDQAFGRAFEGIEPIRPAGPFVVERLFDGPTDRIEAVETCARELVEVLSAKLRERESGCRTLTAELFRSDLPPLALTVRLSRPARDARHLWALLSPLLAAAHMGFGVEGVRLSARAATRLPNEQLHVRGMLAAASMSVASVSRLVDVLASRLGYGRVLNVRLAESHIPERTVRHACARPQARCPRGESVRLVDADRPSRLLATPVPIEATLMAPEGPVLAVRNRGETRRVVSSIGPERIEGEWWRGERGARDYYELGTEDGRRLWVFRQLPGGRWFLHGEWA